MSTLQNLGRATLLVLGLCGLDAHAERHMDQASIMIDGQPRRYYHLHDDTIEGMQPPIVLMNGSGCDDLSARVPLFFKDYPAGIDLYYLEKPGIAAGAKETPEAPCSAEFNRSDALEKRVADALVFIDSEPRLRRAGEHSLAIAGFSEGGVVAPLVAAKSKKIGWLVTVGAGAMRQGDGFLLFADRGVAPYGTLFSRQKFLREFAAIAKDPDSLDKTFFGHPYRFWSRHLFYDPLPTWAALDIHMVAAMGSKDEAEPIEAGHRLRDYFAAHPDKDFQFVEYPGGAHNLKVGDKNNLQAFLAALPKWFLGEAHAFDNAQ